MTRQEARIVVLEDALVQAQHLVSFLYGCLTHPSYEYRYPETTKRNLEGWAALAPCRPLCVHSIAQPDCPACRAHVEEQGRLFEARELLRGEG